MVIKEDKGQILVRAGQGNLPAGAAAGTPARISSGHLQSVIDGIEDELLVIDRDFRIVQVNGAVLRRHRKSRRSVIGRYCYDVSHGSPERCHPPRDECPITHVWETGKASRATHLHLYGPAGVQKRRYIDVIASPVLNRAGKVVYVAEVLRDVTEAKELELKIAEANQDLLALNAIATELSQSLDMDTVLRNAIGKTLEALKADRGGIMLWDEDGKTLRYRVHRGLSAEFVRTCVLHESEGIVGLAVRGGKPILTEDITADGRAVYCDMLGKEGIHGFASVPIVHKDKTLGVLNVASREKRRFSEQEARLLDSIAAQISLAVENARLHQEVQKQDEARGELLNQLFSVQEEERKRIARELHDETTQSLVVMSTGLQSIAASLPADDTDLKKRLKSLQSVTENVLDEMHRLIYELRPSVLDDFGLVIAVRSHIDAEMKKAGIKSSFRVTGRQQRLRPKLESTLFRVIQEAVNNVARHSHATECHVVLAFSKGLVRASITDNGCGFNVVEAMKRLDLPRGLGLLGMQERIGLVNGKLTIESSPGGAGTQVELEVPIGNGRNDE